MWHLSTPNIKANVLHAWLCGYVVSVIRKKIKLSSDGGDSGSKKCKRGYMVGSGGVWSQAVGFVSARFAGI
jgi:hypothetical protein